MMMMTRPCAAEGAEGMMPVPIRSVQWAHVTLQKDGTYGYKVKKWGNGQMGDKNAKWRKGRGLARGMRPLKFIVAKTARG